ncbi:MAG: hypothetical protein AB7F59_12435 [Bdellovibrionales bacterium]
MVKQDRLYFILLFAAGIICRLILLPSTPVLENDYWRYLWDGRVLASGVNPFTFAPNDSALDFLNTPYRNQIGWPEFSTIYPPVAQLFFTFSHIVFGDSLFGLKIVFIFFDLGIWWILVRWLESTNRNKNLSFLYFLNPLVLKEVSNSAHLDTIVVFFTFLSVYLLSQKRMFLRAWVTLALATLTKLFPIILVPLFIKLDNRWKKNLTVFFLVVLLFYIPFIGAGLQVFGGTKAYATYWQFNAGVFHLLDLVLQLFSDNALTTKMAVGVIFSVILYRRTKTLNHAHQLPLATLQIIGAMLILSPVVDAWYVLWVLPLACLTRHTPWIVFSYLVVASYSWFYSKDWAPYFKIAEYTIFFALTGWWHLNNRQNKLETHL